MTLRIFIAALLLSSQICYAESGKQQTFEQRFFDMILDAQSSYIDMTTRQLKKQNDSSNNKALSDSEKRFQDSLRDNQYEVRRYGLLNACRNYQNPNAGSVRSKFNVTFNTEQGIKEYKALATDIQDAEVQATCLFAQEDYNALASTKSRPTVDLARD